VASEAVGLSWALQYRRFRNHRHGPGLQARGQRAV